MDIKKWLENMELGQYASVFAENAIDEDMLPDLSDEDLKELGINKLGHRKKILAAISAGRWQEKQPVDEKSPSPVVSNSSSSQRIFLSYGHDEHVDIALKLKADLEALGHTVWFDAERLKPGGDWESYIEEGLEWVSSDRQTGRVVLLLTPHSVRRPDGYCLNEIARALDRRMLVVPVMVVEVEPPLSICRIQWLDMRDCVPVTARAARYAEKLRQLVSALDHATLDFEGGQSRLINLLNPVPFDADIAQHLPRFTGRKWLFDAFDRWLSDSGSSRVFWIVGRPGVGKTAVAAWLCSHRREVGAFHLCRAGHDQKADPRQVIKNIAYQLSSQLPEYFSRLSAMHDLSVVCSEANSRTLFDRLVVQPLHMGFPAPDRTIVIIIDALDEAGRDGRNELAQFLAHEFANLPDWIRLVITSRPEPEVMQPMQGLEPVVLDAAGEENKSDVREYLVRELKQFSPGTDVLHKAVDVIIERSEGVFLYAEWVRREIEAKRLSIADPDKFPRGLGAAYDGFFTRRFPDINAYQGRVRPMLELAAASFEPPALDDIAYMLNWGAYERAEIPGLVGSLFPCEDGRVRPFHRTLLEWLTVKEQAGAYFASPSEGDRRFIERGLGEFEKGFDAMSAYSKDYLPRHLIRAGRFDEAVRLLADMKCFAYTWNRNEFDLKEWWVQIGHKSNHTMKDAYWKEINEHGADIKTSGLLARLLRDTGHLDESLAIWDWIIAQAREADDREALFDALRRKGFILDDRGDPNSAMALYDEAEEICKGIGSIEGLQGVYRSKGGIYYTWGNLNKAMELYVASERICRETGNKNELQKSLGCQGSIYETWGQLDKAMELHKEEERICRELGNKDGLQGALGSKGWIYQIWGQLDKAMELYKEKERICRELGNKNSLQAALGSQGSIYETWGQLDKAMELHKEEERICRELGNKDDLQRALGFQGSIYETWGQLDKAMDLYKERELICRELGNKDGLQIALGSQAAIYTSKGDYIKALSLIDEAESICRELKKKSGLRRLTGDRGAILSNMGRYDEALPCILEAEKLCIEMNDKRSLTADYFNLGIIYSSRGEYFTALDYHKKGESIARELNDRSRIAESLGFQAGVYWDMGDEEKALKLYIDQEQMCRDLNMQNRLIESIGNQAIILADHKRDIDTAQKKVIEALELANKGGYTDRARFMEYIKKRIDFNAGSDRVFDTGDDELEVLDYRMLIFSRGSREPGDRELLSVTDEGRYEVLCQREIREKYWVNLSSRLCTEWEDLGCIDDTNCEGCTWGKKPYKKDIRINMNILNLGIRDTVRTMPADFDGVKEVRFGLLPDNRRIVTCRETLPTGWEQDGFEGTKRVCLSILFWDIDTGKFDTSKITDHKINYMIQHFYLSHDGSFAVFGTKGTKIHSFGREGFDAEFDLEGRRILVTRDCRHVILYDGKMLHILDIREKRLIAEYQLDFHIDYIRELMPCNKFIAGSEEGEIVFLLKNMNFNPLVVTAYRPWLPANTAPGTGRWGESFVFQCPMCGSSADMSSYIIGAIQAINRDCGIGPEDSPCLKLPGEAREDQRLLAECPRCGCRLKFNPFIVDNKGRWD